MKSMKQRYGAAAQFIAITIAALLSLPVVFTPLSGRLDDSWRFALHKARLNGLVFGTDIVFTYGPLGYLTCPLYIDWGLWLQSLLYTLITHALFWGAIYYFLKRYRARLLITIYTAVGVFVYLQAIIDSYYYFYLFIFAYGYITNKEKNIPLLAAIALIAALCLYIKFSFGMAVALMFMTFIVLLTLEKRYKEAAQGGIMFTMFTVVSGLIMIGGPWALATFFYNSWVVADGYIDAMAVDGPRWKLFTALFAWVVYGTFLLRSIIRKNQGDIYYFAMSLGFLFINYKHSVGNGSIFEWDFFATWGMVFTLYYIKKAGEADERIVIKYAALAASVLLVVLPIYKFQSKAAPIKHLLSLKINQIAAALAVYHDPPLSHEMNRQRLSAWYALSPSTLELLGDHTVDIFTVDAALAGYYGLNWHPRPVFQSYSAYTAYLDQLNERFLSKPDAPEYLLYAPVGFDDKSAVLFEPATYRKILTGYRAAAKDGIFWILKRRENVGPAREEAIASAAVPLGVRIPFNIDDRYYTFARVYVKYNVIGKILRVLYRAPGLYIQFYQGGVPGKRYRFCFNAVNGINLNPFVNNPALEEANEFAITTPSPAFFDKNVEVEFFKVLRQ
ncbi:MAG: hypothetical protein HQK98_05580 [Nitrospirae bacterium]|nr:hypothetical protein [Nitrospirota bacterium]